MDGRIGGLMEGQVERWMDRWINGGTGRKMDAFVSMGSECCILASA